MKFKRCDGHFFHKWQCVMFTGFAEILVCRRCKRQAVRG